MKKLYYQVPGKVLKIQLKDFTPTDFHRPFFLKSFPVIENLNENLKNPLILFWNLPLSETVCEEAAVFADLREWLDCVLNGMIMV